MSLNQISVSLGRNTLNASGTSANIITIGIAVAIVLVAHGIQNSYPNCSRPPAKV